jgi:hypothetical protein
MRVLELARYNIPEKIMESWTSQVGRIRKDLCREDRRLKRGDEKKKGLREKVTSQKVRVVLR